MKQKITIYVESATLDELKSEAGRQDRTISWLLAKAWRLSREQIRQAPGEGRS